MAIDYAEKEREFIDSLAVDTGRDLDGWMSAIAASGHRERNEIIDWLRQQGFLFAKASWLERIHHNGGRPVYADSGAMKGPAPAGHNEAGSATLDHPPPHGETVSRRDLHAASPVAPAVDLTSPGTASAQAPPLPAAPHQPATFAADASHDLTSLLQEAKAYRPLAQHLLRELERHLPGVRMQARQGFVEMHCETVFAILTISARELRLGVNFPEGAAPEPFVKARFTKTHPNVPAQISHMIVLTDARQITPGLIDALVTAARTTI